MKVPIEKIQEVVALEQVMDCFFAGGLAGYAGGGKYVPSNEIPGLKVFTLPEITLDSGARLIYVDSYVSYGLESGGSTYISLLLDGFNPTPLWMMQYGGRELTDDKRVIEFVKEALRDAYSNKRFYGGRGPDRYPFHRYYSSHDVHGGYFYENQPNRPYGVQTEIGAFREPSGIEVVTNLDIHHRVFKHDFQCKLLAVGLK